MGTGTRHAVTALRRNDADFETNEASASYPGPGSDGRVRVTRRTHRLPRSAPTRGRLPIILAA